MSQKTSAGCVTLLIILFSVLAVFFLVIAIRSVGLVAQIWNAVLAIFWIVTLAVAVTNLSNSDDPDT